MAESREAPEYIPISYINAYAYCPRRFYYEFTLAEMVVNEHVLEGQQLHERVDQAGYSTVGDKLQMRRVYVCAPKLGLAGYCDLVEVEGAAGDLAAMARAGLLYPVEYKKGKMGQWLNDHTQLCAQALALEEALAVPSGSVGRGYLFYFGSARRDEVAIDDDLRERTLAMIAEARQVATMNQPPLPITNRRKCHDCSLEPICLPREVLAFHAGKIGGKDGNSVPD
jgi:CRISPR-associated exonuclease Cas4